MKLLITFLSGLIFALGLGYSQMTQPQKVIDFLDITGNWDPSLALVMVGAIGVHLLAYQFKKQTTKPFIEEEYQIPTTNLINTPLVMGAAMFGMGWGLSGFCPGPAMVSLMSGAKEVMLFSGAMFVGFGLHALIKQPAAPTDEPSRTAK